MAPKVLEERARDQGSGGMLPGGGHHEVRVAASSDLSHPLRTRVCGLTLEPRYGFGHPGHGGGGVLAVLKLGWWGVSQVDHCPQWVDVGCGPRESIIFPFCLELPC